MGVKDVLLGADKVVFVSEEGAEEVVMLLGIVMIWNVIYSVLDVNGGLLDMLDVVDVVEDGGRERQWFHHTVTSRHGHTIIGRCHNMSRHHGQRRQAAQSS